MLTTNPGGRLAPDQVIGRDKDAERIWQILERQSVCLAAERRIGKTHVAYKMHDEGRTGFVVFYQDLEGHHSVVEFVHALVRVVRPSLNRWGKAKAIALWLWQNLPAKIAKTEIPTTKERWKLVLASVMADVLEGAGASKVCFIWDEFPLLLHNLIRKEGPESVIQLLDLLRQLRQTHPKLRFLFTGSVGIHLVLRRLHASGAANDFLNDVKTISLPPLSEASAIDLCERLLSSLAPASRGLRRLARRLVREVGGFPYYLHCVVDFLEQSGAPLSEAAVDHAIGSIFFSPSDPAHMKYYYDRLATYYSGDERDLAVAILDAQAKSDTALSLEELTNLVRHELPTASDDKCKEICRLLVLDHYFESNEGVLNFRWPIMKKWWRNRA